jgi:hypothetical protein
MRVRHVRVIVGERRVTMWMAVQLRHGVLVPVPVVLVVDVGVLVLERLVRVGVSVTGPDEEADTGGQDEGRDGVDGRRLFAEEGNGEKGACERRGREDGRLPGRSEQAERPGVEEDAQAVAQAPDHEGGRQGPSPGEGISDREGEPDVEKARGERLGPDEGKRVAQREALRQVVVDAPEEAGGADEEDARQVEPQLSRLPGQEGGAGEDGDRARALAPPEVLAEEGPGEEDGEGALEIEEEAPATPEAGRP